MKPFWATQAIILVFLSGYCISCRTAGPMNAQKDPQIQPNEIWVDRPPAGTEKAIVILLHGLNLRPQKMDDWSKALKSHGALVVRLALHGHEERLGHMSEVSASLWREQFKKALKEAQALTESELPIYFMGFSLGALVGLEWLAGNENPLINGIKKMVLIAPAIATPWYSEPAIGVLGIFGKGFILPSRSPKEYRATKGSSVAAYQALLELKKSLLAQSFRNTNMPTLILLDKHDELIPSNEVKNIITKYHLGQWILDIVDNTVAYQNYGFRHLLVDEGSVGKDLWEALIKKVVSHFSLSL